MAQNNDHQNPEGSRSTLLFGCLGLIAVAVILAAIAYLVVSLILGEPPKPDDVDEIKDEVSFMLEAIRPSIGKLAATRAFTGM